MDNDKWNFEEVKSKIDAMSNDKNRLAYLFSIKEEYENERLEEELSTHPMLFAAKNIQHLGEHSFFSKLNVLVQFYEKRVSTKLPEPPSNNTRLIWNGNKSTLADAFYQLKRLTLSNGKPLLDNSDTEIAVFLKNNFHCFKDTAIDTIRGYLTKEEKRPSLSKNKLTISYGFPNKE